MTNAEPSNEKAPSVQQFTGLTAKCDWLEFLYVDLDELGSRVAVCRQIGTSVLRVVAPTNWEYEGSLSQKCVVSDASSQMTFLRPDDGVDVYLNRKTGEEVYVGRTNK